MKLRKCACSFYSVYLLLGSLVSETFAITQKNQDFHQRPSIYDFVIVGGGVAGCVLARRLSEDGKLSVLLLEAGGFPPDFLMIPALAKKNEILPEITFQYKSVPQKHGGFSNNGGVFRIPLGRVLGGTSQINSMVFNRGHPKDYDNWANLSGDRSWEYSNMLKYFRKSETYLGEFPSTIHHGNDGPIPVSYQHFAPGKEIWLEAGRELGYHVGDANGAESIGFGPIEYSTKFGRRVSSYKGYIEPIVTSRGNLRIITNAFVTQVLFAKDGVTVTGVAYSDNMNGTQCSTGVINVIYAKREVILSAGTYGSSTILMRSGIGPSEVLRSAGIHQISSLPVGENFQIHPIVPLHILFSNKSLSFDPELDLNPETFELWRKFGVGPYSGAAGYSGQIYFASSVAIKENHKEWPDIHLRYASSNTILAQFKDNFIAPWETSIQLNLYLARQKSRGTVKLNSNDIYGEPLIDFNFLEDKRDVDILLDAIKLGLNIFERTNAYQRQRARIFREPLPVCAHHHFRSEMYWRCYIRELVRPGHHPVGTCAMRKVVDSKLRVLGLRGIRVVDGSVMETITNSNLQAVIYAIAEKASDDILRDHDYYRK